MAAALLVASILLSSQDPVTEPAPRRIAPQGSGTRSTRAEEPSAGGFVFWTVVVAAAAAGGLALLRRSLRGSSFGGAGSAIGVLARRAVGPRQELILVEVGPRVLLIGSTREGLSTLAEFSDARDIGRLKGSELPAAPAEREADAVPAWTA